MGRDLDRTALIMKRKILLNILAVILLVPVFGIFHNVEAQYNGAYDFHCSLTYEVSYINDDGSLSMKSCHSSYDEAKTALDQLNGDYVIRNRNSYSPTKIVAMKSGYVYSYPGRSGSITMKVYELPSFKIEEATYSYMTNHWQMTYLETYRSYTNGTGCIKVRFNGYEGYTDLEYTDLVPSKYVERGIGIWLGGNNTYEYEDPFYVVPEPDYYEVVKNGNYMDLKIVYHQMYPKKNTSNPVTYSSTIGPALDFMKTGKRYYSDDSYHFYNDVNFTDLAGTGLSYYQFLPLRTYTSISADKMDSYLRSKIGSEYSAMSGKASAFISSQKEYGVNALLVFCMGMHESNFGTHVYATNYYNFFGWSAFDDNPSNATQYNSAEGAIRAQMGYNLTAYLDSKDWRHMSSSLGNKGSGVNVYYASDPYWSVKISAYAYDLDKYANNYNGSLSDYNDYVLGIVKEAGVEVKSKADASSSTLYKIHQGRSSSYISNYVVVVLGEENGYVKIRTTNPVSNGRIVSNADNSTAQLLSYDKNTAIGYIPKDKVIYVNKAALSPGDYIYNTPSLSTTDDGLLKMSGYAYRQYAYNGASIYLDISGTKTVSYKLNSTRDQDVINFSDSFDMTSLPEGSYSFAIRTDYGDSSLNGSYKIMADNLPYTRVIGSRIYVFEANEGVLILHIRTALGANDSPVARIYGGNRYETALKAAQLYYEKNNYELTSVILTTGENYADALSASYLSYLQGAPIIAINEQKASEVKEFIRERLDADGTIYVLGGEDAVSDKCLEGLSFDIVRISGSNRYKTNLNVLEETGVPGQILVCTGEDYADTLSASSLCLPILIVRDELAQYQIEALSSMEGVHYTIIGGENAVSSSVEKQLRQFGSVERISGENRYDTSVKIARYFYSDPDSAIVVYGRNFPDGLFAGPLSKLLDIPIILTARSASSSVTDYMHDYGITSGYVLGGPALIPDSTVRKIFSLSEDTAIFAR